MAFVGGLFKEPKVPGLLLLKELNRFVELYDWTLNMNVIGSIVPLEFMNNSYEKLKIRENLKLSHFDAYKLAAESDFLILLLGNIPDAKLIMHGKYSHYLSLGNPILAFVPEGSFIQRSINLTNSGFFVDINSDIAESLNNIFVSIAKNGLPERNLKEIENFSDDNFKKSWVNLIEEQSQQLNEKKSFTFSPPWKFD